MKTIKINKKKYAQIVLESLVDSSNTSSLESFALQCIIDGNTSLANSIETLGDLLEDYNGVDGFPTYLIVTPLKDLIENYNVCNSKGYEYISEEDFTNEELSNILVEFI